MFSRITNRILSKKHVKLNVGASFRSLWSYDHRPSENQLLYETYHGILKKSVEAHPDRLAVISCHQSYPDGRVLSKTFQEFHQDVYKLAAGFMSLGLAKGSKVSVLSSNNYEWIMLQYAIAHAGLVLVTLNPALMESEILYSLNETESQALVMADSFRGTDYFQIMSNICPELERAQSRNLKSKNVPNLKHVITMFDQNKPGTIPLKELSEKGESKDLQNELEGMLKNVQSDDCVNVQLTSGTTGKPKAVCLSHHGILNCAFGFGRAFLTSTHERICTPVPLFHCFGNTLSTTAMCCVQATAVLPSPSFDAQATLKAIQDHQCTVIYATPTMYIDLLNCNDFSQYNYSSMRAGIMAASTCPEELLKAVNEKLHVKDICVAYGTTENSPLITLTDVNDPLEIRCSTVGRACEHMETKVIDSEGRIVKRGEIGELCSRGFQVMLGYFNDEKKTKEVMDETRWYKTGDLATMDDLGNIKIVGRIKDMIIRGGENIYPREIEDFLHTHPSIAEVQVFGVPDKRLGEIVCAWIKLRADENITEDDVRDYCKDKIAKFKIPKHISFVDSFPTTTSGKVKKYQLTKIMNEKLKCLN